jgi:hypothetical protein
MKRLNSVAVATLLGLTGASSAHAAATCKQTGFVRDGINLTAAIINPTSTVTGDVNATGCDIGVFFGTGQQGTVDTADIYGATYFGVVNNGANVNVRNSSISNIGDVPFDGAQHGVGIYFYGGDVQGQIANNIVWKYQKNGIAVSLVQTTIDISNNTVIGEGPVNYIAQNGIEVLGATARVRGNTVSGNAYTGPNVASAGGITLVGGAYFTAPPTTNTEVSKNTVVGNDVGVFDVNALSATSPVRTPTNNKIRNNVAIDNVITNTTGSSSTMGYQAGISVFSNGDSIDDNYICGLGYTGASTSAYSLHTIDTSGSASIEMKGNTVCPSALPAVVGAAIAVIPSASAAVAKAPHPSP